MDYYPKRIRNPFEVLDYDPTDIGHKKYHEFQKYLIRNEIEFGTLKREFNSPLLHAYLTADLGMSFEFNGLVYAPTALNFGPFKIRKIPSINSASVDNSVPLHPTNSYTILHRGISRNHTDDEIFLIEKERERLSKVYNDGKTVELELEYFMLEHDLMAIKQNSMSGRIFTQQPVDKWEPSFIPKSTFFKYEERVTENGDTNANRAVDIFAELIGRHLPYSIEDLDNILQKDWNQEPARLSHLNMILEKKENVLPFNWTNGYI